MPWWGYMAMGDRLAAASGADHKQRARRPRVTPQSGAKCSPTGKVGWPGRPLATTTLSCKRLFPHGELNPGLTGESRVS